MKSSITNYLEKKAAVLLITDKNSSYLKKEDINLLNKIAPSLVLKVKENVDNDKDPLKGLTYDDKIILLSFVVYKRQNIATTPKDIPNEEDASIILNKGIYKGNKNKKNLDRDLMEQLAKAGFPLKK
jgi:hypothetical protein